jgi:hypothetical protein
MFDIKSITTAELIKQHRKISEELGLKALNKHLKVVGGCYNSVKNHPDIIQIDGLRFIQTRDKLL